MATDPTPPASPAVKAKNLRADMKIVRELSLDLVATAFGFTAEPAFWADGFDPVNCGVAWREGARGQARLFTCALRWHDREARVLRFSTVLPVGVPNRVWPWMDRGDMTPVKATEVLVHESEAQAALPFVYRLIVNPSTVVACELFPQGALKHGAWSTRAQTAMVTGA